MTLIFLKWESSLSAIFELETSTKFIFGSALAKSLKIHLQFEHVGVFNDNLNKL
jgi:hypothetical protein